MAQWEVLSDELLKVPFHLQHIHPPEKHLGLPHTAALNATIKPQAVSTKHFITDTKSFNSIPTGIKPATFKKKKKKTGNKKQRKFGHGMVLGFFADNTEGSSFGKVSVKLRVY